MHALVISISHVIVHSPFLVVYSGIQLGQIKILLFSRVALEIWRENVPRCFRGLRDPLLLWYCHCWDFGKVDFFFSFPSFSVWCMVDADMPYVVLVLSQGLGNQNLLTHSTCSVESRIIWCHEPTTLSWSTPIASFEAVWWANLYLLSPKHILM